MGSRTKNDNPINNANKIYSLTVNDNTKNLSFTLNDGRMMGTRMNDCTHNIIEVMTRCIFINCKGTTIIGMARSNQLVSHLKGVILNNQRVFRMKFKISKFLKLKGIIGK